MKRDLINKIVLGTIISTTLFSLVPTKASAEWANDYQGNSYYMYNGQKVTGWKKIDGSLYYFDSYGRMQKGWIQAGDSWYYLQNDGSLKTGWINYNKNWYYADSSGAIQTGVINIEGKVYIFDSKGVMKNSNTIINGVFYTIGSDGQVAGDQTPTPDKELDSAGNLVRVITTNSSKTISSPTASDYNEVVQDKTQADYEDAKEGRKFTLTFKDSKTGGIIKTETVKYDKSFELYGPTKTGYKFKEWNTRNDGSGNSYDDSDKIKIKGDTVLYAQWNDDTNVYVNGITISGSAYVTAGKTAQMTAQVSPSNASSSAVTWSVTNGTGKATIDASTGVLTGVTEGTITVKATANDGSNVSATKDVTISQSDVVVNVTNIAVTTKTGGTPVITANGGTLDMIASILPSEATNQDVDWTVENGTGSASISSMNGKTITIKAISNGTVTVKATAKDGSGIVGSATVSISGQTTVIPVESVSISPKNPLDSMEITKNDGTLQLTANILPTTASNTEVNWTITEVKDSNGVTITKAEDIAKFATISKTGVITAIDDGTIKVQVTTADGSKTDTKYVNIAGQIVKIAKIDINDPGIINGTQPVNMTAVITGENSKVITTGAALRWTIVNGTGSATINQSTGQLTPVSDGTVTVKAAATDGSAAVDTQDVTINGTKANVAISNITVATATGATRSYISDDNGTVEFIASINPTYATTAASEVTWSIVDGDDGGSAIIENATGNKVLVKAVNNGTVTIYAKVPDKGDNNKIKTGSATLSIYNQIQEVTSIKIDDPFNAKVGSDGKIMGYVGKNEGLLLTATVNGGDAQYQKVAWKIIKGNGDKGSGSFDATVNGLLKGGSYVGTLQVVAVSTDKYQIESDPMTIMVTEPSSATDVKINLPKDSKQNDINTIVTNNGTLTLSATVGDKTATSNVVTWAVSDPSKAKIVDNGDSTATITALQNGTVDVIATGSGGKAADSKTITIQNQDATGLTVNSENGVNQITGIGDTLKMTYSLVPNTAIEPTSIEWSVSDTSKASVVASADKKTATITAKDNGNFNVIVTAKTANGVTLTNYKSITVNAPRSITINNGSGSVSGGNITLANGDTVTLSAAVLPTGLEDSSVTWAVDDASKLEISSSDSKSATFKAKATGQVVVTARANKNVNVTSTTTITIGN